jgi:hypothetical protein
MLVIQQNSESARSDRLHLLNFAPRPSGRALKPFNKRVEMRKRCPRWLAFSQACANGKSDFGGWHGERTQTKRMSFRSQIPCPKNDAPPHTNGSNGSHRPITVFAGQRREANWDGSRNWLACNLVLAGDRAAEESPAGLTPISFHNRFIASLRSRNERKYLRRQL